LKDEEGVKAESQQDADSKPQLELKQEHQHQHLVQPGAGEQPVPPAAAHLKLQPEQQPDE
jgi:hypothetical protein